MAFLRRFLMVLAFASAAATSAFAQSQVSGTVKDLTGAGLAGVVVMEEDTQNATATDIDGKYSLTVSSDQVSLRFTCIGYYDIVTTIPRGGDT